VREPQAHDEARTNLESSLLAIWDTGFELDLLGRVTMLTCLVKKHSGLSPDDLDRVKPEMTRHVYLAASDRDCSNARVDAICAALRETLAALRQ